MANQYPREGYQTSLPEMARKSHLMECDNPQRLVSEINEAYEVGAREAQKVDELGSN